MYFVKYGKDYLHDPRVDGYVLLDLSFETSENSCGYCDFTIYPDHSMYDKLKERDYTNLVQVYDDDILIFSGFIYELGKDFQLSGEVKCKGELAILEESIIRPYSTHTRGYGNKAPDSVNKLFEWYIEQHNEQTDVSKQFAVGVNQGAALDSNNYVFRESNQYPTTFAEIEEKLLNSLGGYLRIRHENDTRYIDYLSEWTDSNSQVLDFGVNLTDYTQTDDSEDIATFVIPLGAKMSETEYSYNDGYAKTTDTSVDSYKDYYLNTSSYSYVQYSSLESFETGKTYYEYDEVKETYSVTTDTTVDSDKTYYSKSTKKSYNTCSKLKEFKFYERNEDANKYYVTSDKTVNSSKEYYYSTTDGNYSSCGSIQSFTFYEYDTNNDESDLELTVKGLTDYTPETDYIKSADMVYCPSAVKKYGWIGITYDLSYITIRENLVTKGVIALKEYISPKRTIEIKAVDMHLINPEMKPIKVGEYVRVRSKPHNFDSYMLCTKVDLDLNNPENSLYTLGTTFDTLTGQQNKRIKTLNTTINQQYEAAAALSEEAKKNALDANSTAEEAKKTADTATDTANKAKEAADVAITSTYTEFATSLTPTGAPTDGWSTDSPEYTSDVFVWSRTVSTYGNGTTETGPAVCITGNTGADGEDAVLLRIDSSRGTVFKNNSISTVLSAVIYKGSRRITDITTLHSVFGSGAYLQWSWQKIDESSFGVISASDSMIGNNGFTLTISADEVDEKCTFMCDLIL